MSFCSDDDSDSYEYSYAESSAGEGKGKSEDAEDFVVDDYDDLVGGGATAAPIPKVELELPEELLHPQETKIASDATKDPPGPTDPKSRISAESSSWQCVPPQSRLTEGLSAGASAVHSHTDASEILVEGSYQSVISEVEPPLMTEFQPMVRYTSGTTAESSYTFHNDTTTHLASSNASLVSGFDCLDVGGFAMRRCHLDGYLNPEGTNLCKGCGAALVANPCVDIDHQIALHLHQKEEGEAFAQVQRLEQERAALASLPTFQQAQALSDDLTAYLHQQASVKFKKPYQKEEEEEEGYRPLLTEAERTHLATRFLDCAKKRQEEVLEGQEFMEPLRLAYYFTDKQHDAVRLKKLIRNPNQTESIKVMENNDQHQGFNHWYEHVRPMQCRSTLGSIAEGKQQSERSRKDVEDSAVCWIMALAPGRSSESGRAGRVPPGHALYNPIKIAEAAVQAEEQRKAREEARKVRKEMLKASRMKLPATPGAGVNTENSQDAQNAAPRPLPPRYTSVMTLHNAHDASLPLVCFPAAWRNHNETHRLFRGLEQVCLDFFGSVGLADARPQEVEEQVKGSQPSPAGTALADASEAAEADASEAAETAAALVSSNEAESPDQKKPDEMFFVGGYAMRSCGVCDQLYQAHLASCPRKCQAAPPLYAPPSPVASNIWSQEADSSGVVAADGWAADWVKQNRPFNGWTDQEDEPLEF